MAEEKDTKQTIPEETEIVKVKLREEYRGFITGMCEITDCGPFWIVKVLPEKKDVQ